MSQLQYLPPEQQTKILAQGVTEEELQTQHDEFLQTLQDLGVPETEYQSRMLRRFKAYLTKKTYQGATRDIEYIALGTKISDYGAQKFYDETKKLATGGSFDVALERGLVNDKGQPLYQKGFNKGKVIEVDNEGNVTNVTKQVMVYWRNAGSEDQLQRGEVNIKQQFNVPQKLFTLMQATVTEGKIEEGYGRFTQLEQPKPHPEATQLKHSDILALAKELEPEAVVAIDDNFGQKAAMLQETYRYAFVHGDLIANGLMLGGEDKTNNAINLMPTVGGAEDFGDSLTMTGWMPKNNIELPTNVQDGAQDIIAVGRISLNQNDNTPTMNVYGLYVHPAYLIKQDAKPVVPQESQTVEATTEEEFI